MLMMPLQQLKYNAGVFKNDPDFVRRQQPKLAKATNAEIIECAEAMLARAATMKEDPGAAERQAEEAQIDMVGG